MRYDDPRNIALVRMRKTGAYWWEYYDAIGELTDYELRRLWLAEGRRRGYEVN